MIEYVTICVNYLDYFKIAYKHNKNQFDHFIVVTDNKDKETAEFCKAEGLTLVQTDCFYENGTIFNKGAAINKGFEKLKYNDWVSLMDADTFVKSDFRFIFNSFLDMKALNKEFMYGAERVLLTTPEDYKNYVLGKSENEFEIPEGFGYGYFLLFNWNSLPILNSVGGKWHPAAPDCRECDWMFRNKWGDFDGSHAKWKGNFEKYPQRVLNLGRHGVNHFGRVSEKFLIDNS